MQISLSLAFRPESYSYPFGSFEAVVNLNGFVLIATNLSIVHTFMRVVRKKKVKETLAQVALYICIRNTMNTWSHSLSLLLQQKKTPNYSFVMTKCVRVCCKCHRICVANVWMNEIKYAAVVFVEGRSKHKYVFVLNMMTIFNFEPSQALLLLLLYGTFTVVHIYLRISSVLIRLETACYTLHNMPAILKSLN